MQSLVLAVVLAATPSLPGETKNSQEQLSLIRNQIQEIQALQKQGLEVDKDGKVVAALLQKAHDLTTGQVNTYDDLIQVTTSLWDKSNGLFTFVNILLVTSIILIVAAIAWLSRLYFIFLIMEVPPKVWNVIFWIACIVLVFSGTKVSSDYYLFLVFPGCLGMVATWAFTCYLYFENKDNYEFYFGVLAVIWAAVALAYDSHVIGFISVMAFLSALGFVCGTIPGVVWIGFESDKVIPRATFAAGFMLFLHVLLTMAGGTAFAPFRDGMNFMGSFVFYLGLLITSSKWYSWGFRAESVDWRLYWSKQMFTVVMGFLALYIGSVYQMHTLLGVGGTFFYIYILEKYYEVPWEGKGWAWSLLGLGGILYYFALYARSHPQYFLLIGE